MLIPNLNTLADVIDRLIVEVNKLSYFENKKREEHAKEFPDEKMIAYWDNLSRDCCEYRSMLKNEINRILSDIVSSENYQTLKELRTFRAPKKSVADLLAERCGVVGSEDFKQNLIRSLVNELTGTPQVKGEKSKMSDKKIISRIFDAIFGVRF